MSKKTFHRYQIVEELGAGGMGLVYKAYDPQRDGFVALKVLTIPSKENQQRFDREARAIASLDHPSIIRFHEIGHDDGKAFFTMDYVDGLPLDQWRKTKIPTMKRIAQVMKEICSAVHYAHKNSIIHRDLKPENVMIHKSGRPIVMDFGLAKTAEDSKLSRTGAIMGTLQYMPPEQASGSLNRIDHVSDVYSLGAILYELLTGRPPFGAGNQTTLKVIYQISEKNARLPSRINKDVPDSLEAVCLKAISKNKKDRYQSAAEMAKEFERFLQDQPVQAKLVAKKKQTSKSNPNNFLAIAVVLLLVISGLILTQKGKTSPQSSQTHSQKKSATKQKKPKQPPKRHSPIIAQATQQKTSPPPSKLPLGKPIVKDESAKVSLDEQPVDKFIPKEFLSQKTEPEEKPIHTEPKKPTSKIEQTTTPDKSANPIVIRGDEWIDKEWQDSFLPEEMFITKPLELYDNSWKKEVRNLRRKIKNTDDRSPKNHLQIAEIFQSMGYHFDTIKVLQEIPNKNLEHIWQIIQNALLGRLPIHARFYLDYMEKKYPQNRFQKKGESYYQKLIHTYKKENSQYSHPKTKVLISLAKARLASIEQEHILKKQYITNATQLAPGTPWVIWIQALVVISMIQDQDFQQSQKMIQHISKANPRFPNRHWRLTNEINFLQALWHFYQGEKSQAKTIFAKTINHPQTAPPLRKQCKSYLKLIQNNQKPAKHLNKPFTAILRVISERAIAMSQTFLRGRRQPIAVDIIAPFASFEIEGMHLFHLHLASALTRSPKSLKNPAIVRQGIYHFSKAYIHSARFHDPVFHLGTIAAQLNKHQEAKFYFAYSKKYPPKWIRGSEQFMQQYFQKHGSN